MFFLLLFNNNNNTIAWFGFYIKKNCRNNNGSSTLTRLKKRFPFLFKKKKNYNFLLLSHPLIKYKVFVILFFNLEQSCKFYKAIHFFYIIGEAFGKALSFF